MDDLTEKLITTLARKWSKEELIELIEPELKTMESGLTDYRNPDGKRYSDSGHKYWQSVPGAMKFLKTLIIPDIDLLQIDGVEVRVAKLDDLDHRLPMMVQTIAGFKRHVEDSGAKTVVIIPVIRYDKTFIIDRTNNGMEIIRFIEVYPAFVT